MMTTETFVWEFYSEGLVGDMMRWIASMEDDWAVRSITPLLSDGTTTHVIVVFESHD